MGARVNVDLSYLDELADAKRQPSSLDFSYLDDMAEARRRQMAKEGVSIEDTEALYKSPIRRDIVSPIKSGIASLASAGARLAGGGESGLGLSIARKAVGAFTGKPEAVPTSAQLADEFAQKASAERLKRSIAQTDAPRIRIPFTDIETSVAGAFSGAIESIVKTAPFAVGAPYLLPGKAAARVFSAIAGSALTEANEALTEAAKAGLTSGKRLTYAAARGIVEGGIAAFFQKLGLGGAESLLAARASLRGAMDAGVKHAAKTAGIQLGAELTEENLTEITHNITDRLAGINPNALTKENILQTIADTTAQTVVQFGMLGGARALEMRLTRNEEDPWAKKPKYGKPGSALYDRQIDILRQSDSKKLEAFAKLKVADTDPRAPFVKEAIQILNLRASAAAKAPPAAQAQPPVAQAQPAPAVPQAQPAVQAQPPVAQTPQPVVQQPPIVQAQPAGPPMPEEGELLSVKESLEEARKDPRWERYIDLAYGDEDIAHELWLESMEEAGPTQEAVARPIEQEEVKIDEEEAVKEEAGPSEPGEGAADIEGRQRPGRTADAGPETVLRPDREREEAETETISPAQTPIAAPLTDAAQPKEETNAEEQPGGVPANPQIVEEGQKKDARAEAAEDRKTEEVTPEAALESIRAGKGIASRAARKSSQIKLSNVIGGEQEFTALQAMPIDQIEALFSDDAQYTVKRLRGIAKQAGIAPITGFTRNGLANRIVAKIAEDRAKSQATPEAERVIGKKEAAQQSELFPPLVKPKRSAPTKTRPAEAQPTKAQPAEAQPTRRAVKDRLPKSLSGAKPRYGKALLTFESDMDMAAYIAAQKNKSKRDADYVQFVMDITGYSEQEARDAGKRVKQAISKLTDGMTEETVTVPPVLGRGPEFSPTQSSPGMGADAVNEAIGSMLKKWKNIPKGGVKVLNNNNEAPGHIQKAAPPQGWRGVYDPSTDTVYLSADKIADAKEAIFVLMHETVGHKGIMAVLGKDDAEKFYFEVAVSRNKEISAYAKANGIDFNTKEEKIHAAKEWLADKIGAGDIKPIKSIMARLSQAVHRAVAKLTGDKYSNAHIRAMVNAAHGYIEEGPKASTPAQVEKRLLAATLEAWRVWQQSKVVREKPDFRWTAQIFSKPAFYYHQIPAAKSILEIGERYPKDAHVLARSLLDMPNGASEFAAMAAYKKQFGDTEQGKRTFLRLITNDRNRIGRRVSEVPRIVRTKKGKIKKLKEKEFAVIDHDGTTELGRFKDRDTAVEAMFLLESKDMKEQGFADADILYTLSFRHISYRGYRMLEGEVEQLANEAKMLARALPPNAKGSAAEKQVKDVISLYRAMKEMGNAIGYYFPRMHANGRLMRWVEGYGEAARERHLIKADTRTGIALKSMAFPKDKYQLSPVRPTEGPGESVFAGDSLIDLHDLLQNGMEQMVNRDLSNVTFDSLHMVAGRHQYARRDGGREQHLIVNAPLRDDLNALFTSMGGKYFDDKQNNRGKAWHFVNPGENFENELLEQLAVTEIAYRRQADFFFATLVNQLADFYKARGSRRFKIARSDAVGEDVYWGYELDPNKALMAYVQATAWGTAKRYMIRDMINVFNGTDVSFEEFSKAELAGLTEEEQEARKKTLYTDYMDMVNAKRLDSGTQPNAFRDLKSYVAEMARNTEAVDRIFGTIRGLAAIKYLSASATGLVNLATLATSLPATMSSYAGIPFVQSTKLIQSAVRDYHKYLIYNKFGKGSAPTGETAFVLDEIIKRGWDVPLAIEEIYGTLQGRIAGYARTFSDALMFVFMATERTNRAASILASYMGMYRAQKGAWTDEDRENALNKAKFIADRANGVYGKVNLNEFQRGTSAFAQSSRAALAFLQYSWNYLNLLYELGVNKKDAKAAAWLMISPAVVGGVGSSVAAPFMSAAAKLAGTAVSKLVPGTAPPDDPWEELASWVDSHIGQYAGRFVRYGAIGLFPGVSIRGSLDFGLGKVPIGASKAIKGDPVLGLGELLGPAGSVFIDAGKAVSAAAKGDWARAAEYMAPRAFASKMRAVREYLHGVTTETGKPVYFGEEQIQPSMLDTLKRMAGFYPVSIAEIREKQWGENVIKQKYAGFRQEIMDDLRRWWMRGEGDMNRILVKIENYNARVARKRIQDVPLIDDDWVMNVFRRAEVIPKAEEARARPELITPPEVRAMSAEQIADRLLAADIFAATSPGETPESAKRRDAAIARLRRKGIDRRRAVGILRNEWLRRGYQLSIDGDLAPEFRARAMALGKIAANQ